MAGPVYAAAVILAHNHPSGWAKASGDPQLDWESARRVSQGYGPGGAHEWRLPSMAELKELYGYWKKSGDGEFSAALSWSSSPWGGGSAWYVGFDDGYEYHSFKESTNYVRPVRTD